VQWTKFTTICKRISLEDYSWRAAEDIHALIMDQHRTVVARIFIGSLTLETPKMRQYKARKASLAGARANV
jgi:uncharacterized UPF0146 family protein